MKDRFKDGPAPVHEVNAVEFDRRRRALLAASGAFAATACFPPGVFAADTPRRPPTALSALQARTLAALGDILVPGAAAARLADYVGDQLVADGFHSTLLIRYLDWPTPHVDFYREGLDALERVAKSRATRGFAELSAEAADGFVRQLALGQLQGWSGPPQPLFFFVVRNDALDVVYGTPAGFEALGVAYFAHVPPTTPWPRNPM